MNASTRIPFHAVALAALLGLSACGGGGSSSDNTGANSGANPPAGGGGTETPAGTFSLSLSTDKAQLLQGGSTAVRVAVLRQGGFSGAVALDFSDLPAGVSVPAATIPAGTSDIEVVLTAATTAAHSLPTVVTVRGSATGVATSAETRRAFNLTVRGAAGVMDTSFGGGIVTSGVDIGEDYARAVAVQADGKVVVAGSSSTVSGTWVSLVRYQRDGSLDTSFGNGGKVVTPIGNRGNDAAAAIAIQNDGAIVVAGSAEMAASGHDFVLLRYTAAGVLDSGFGNGGKVVTDFGGNTDRAWALLVLPDGRIVAGGETNTGNNAGGVDFALARYSPAGVLDTSFGNGGKVVTPIKASTGTDIVRSLALQTVAGEARLLAVGGEGDFQAARYSANGGLDSGFGNNGRIAGLFNASIGSARAVNVLPDGSAVVAGHIDHHFAVVRLTAAGQPDGGFGAAGNGRFESSLVPNWNEATALVRQADGKLIVGGWAYSGNGSSGDFAVLRLSADGRLDTGFGNNGVVIAPLATGTRNDQGHALVLQADDRVSTVRAIQAGEANGSNHDFAVVRWWL